MTDNSRAKANTSPITDQGGSNIYPDIGQSDFFPPQTYPHQAPRDNDNVASLLRDIRELLNSPDRVHDLDIGTILVKQGMWIPILENRNRVSLSLYNDSLHMVYVFTRDWSTTDGMPIPPGSERELGTPKALWLRCEDGDALIRYQDERLPY